MWEYLSWVKASAWEGKGREGFISEHSYWAAHIIEGRSSNAIGGLGMYMRYRIIALREGGAGRCGYSSMLMADYAYGYEDPRSARV